MGESLDDVLGMIYFHDLALPLSEGRLHPETPIKPWITPVKVVPETLSLNDLLNQMQQAAREMVIVVDEYGGTAGLVTFRDLTAEIVGDLDEADTTAQIIAKDPYTFIFSAQTELEEVNERLSLDLPTSDDYITLGGFVIFEMQKIPSVNEQLQHQDLEFTVVAAEGPKLTKIQIRRPGRALTLYKTGAAAAPRKDSDRAATDKSPSLLRRSNTKPN